ncbi:MAG TPA: hypothetical protein PLF26_11780 [Blastocatellia bacterium]|nr:hypothetical protein [Blastocatellia bacterium]
MFLSRFVTVALVCVVLVPASSGAQRKGEYITPDEMELVQGIRRIDNRAKVFLKIADRRLVAIQDPASEPKDTRGTSFGPLPSGSQIELLDDYRRAIEELMAKLDDEFERTGMSPELYTALKYTKQEIVRQLGVLDALKLTQPDADRYAKKARAAAEELDEGTTEALANNPAPAKKP